MKGIISCGHPATARAANAAMLSGGNAYDAAICALLVACVAEPCIASLSSGMLGVFKTTDSAVWDINAFAQAPAKRKRHIESEIIAFDVDFINSIDRYYYGRGTIATAGYFHGIIYFLNHARLPFKEHIDICGEQLKHGVALSEFSVEYLNYLKPTFKSDSLYKLYCDADKEVLKTGTVIRNTGFNDLLSTVKDEGIDLVIRGDVPEEIHKLIGDKGHLSRGDLVNYNCKIHRIEPYPYNDSQVFIHDFPSWGSEICKFLLGMDSGSVERSLYEAIEQIETQNILEKWQAKHQSTSVKFSGTGHLSIADERGNMLSLTYSLGEGSGFMTPYSGIHLNNMLGEPALFSGKVDEWRTGEQLISMMSPCIVENGKATIGLGSGGSERIPQVVYQMIYKLSKCAEESDLNMPALKTIVEEARAFYKDGVLHVEPGYPISDELDFIGEINEFQSKSLFFGGINAVATDNSAGLIAYADGRRDGIAIEIG